MNVANYISEHLGLSAEMVTLLVVALAGLAAAIGTVMLALSALSLTRDDRGSRDNWRMVSKLLPLLAQDTLDKDLRAVYQKSLYLDALIADVAPALTTPTGTELGREIRRELLAIEAKRYRDGEDAVDTAALDDLCLAMDAAIDAAERERPAPHVDVRALAEALEIPSGGSRSDRAI